MDNASTLAVEAPPRSAPSHSLALFSLALASFAIGTTEFASMGIIQLFSATLAIDIPTATHAITAYALGVVVGAPVITLAAAKLNRRTMLLALMGLFIVGNLLSSIAPSITMLVGARFISGLTQGAYFGAGAVVATHIVGPERAGKAFSLVVSGLTVATIFGSPLATFFGQHLGWRETYVAVAALGGLSFAALWAWIPRTEALAGRPVVQELSALAQPRVWWMMTVAAIAVASIFAVYTFIAPFVTDAAGLLPAMVPIGLALFGIGMTLGNIVGGRLADRYQARGLLIGFGLALPVLAAIAAAGSNPLVLLAGVFGVGFTTMTAIPTIQVRLTRMAPEAPTMMGAMNMASLNLSNAIGAWAGGIVIGAGMGLLSAAWAGFALTLVGLTIFIAGRARFIK